MDIRRVGHSVDKGHHDGETHHVLSIFLWVVVIIIAAVGVIRTWGAGNIGRGAVVAAAAPFFFVLSWPAAVIALLERQWIQGAAATFLAGCQVAWAYQRRQRSPTDADPIVTVFTVNASFRNPDIGLIAEEIAASSPDVVIVLELTPGHVATLSASGALDTHHWNLVLPQERGAWGIGLWSRVPARDLRQWELQGIPQVRGLFQLPGDQSLSIVAVHVPAPWPGSAQRWVAGLAELGHAVALETRPVVVAGDLNATWDHRRFRDLMETGLRDAAIEAGRGWARTWPSARRAVPFLRLDHILLCGDVAVAAYRIGPGHGSDHRSVMAELGVTNR
jgi:endonuclease/exonuclease/phosphatase (EEP) superfamily protein YafD